MFLCSSLQGGRYQKRRVVGMLCSELLQASLKEDGGDLGRWERGVKGKGTSVCFESTEEPRCCPLPFLGPVLAACGQEVTWESRESF